MATRTGERAASWAVALAVVFLALAFLLHPDSLFNRRAFLDPDDYMRFVRVFAWLDGAGWWDHSIGRFALDADFVLGWSRLVDAPLAAGVALLTPLLGRFDAAFVTAYLVPLLLLVAILATFMAAVRPVIGRRHMWLVVPVFFALIPMLHEFRPMRIDHHGWQLLAAAGVYMFLLRDALRPDRCALFGVAALGAIGLFIGAEAALWLGLVIGWVLMTAAAMGEKRARNGALALSLLMVLTALFWPLARWGDEFMTIDFTRLSVAHVTALTLAAALGWLLAQFAFAPRWVRFAALALGGSVAAGVFLTLVPMAWDGIYGGMSGANQDILLTRVIEAQSLWQRLQFAADHNMVDGWRMIALRGLALPLVALLVVLWRLCRTLPRGRRVWLLCLWMLLPCLLLTLFWQSRVANYAALFALLPLVVMAARAKAWRRLIVICIVLTPGVLALPLVTAARVWPDLVFYPVERLVVRCDLQKLQPLLEPKKYLRLAPHNILLPLGYGPELLFRTRHNAVAAPYDLRGNAVAQDFWQTDDMARAEAMLRHARVDVVAICENFPAYYYPNADALAARILAVAARVAGAPMTTQLMAGRIMVDRLTTNDAPDFLRPIQLQEAGGWHLFRLREGQTPAYNWEESLFGGRHGTEAFWHGWDPRPGEY